MPKSQQGYTISKYRGRYKVRVRDPYTRRYLSKSFTNQREGEAWAKSQRAKYLTGADMVSDITLEQAAEQYARRCEQLGKSSAYVRHIRMVARKAAEFGIRKLSDPLIPGRAQAWLAELTAQRYGQRQAKPASARTKNYYLKALRSIGHYAVRQGHLLRNPFVACDTVHEEQRNELVFSFAELCQIVDPQHRHNPWWLFAVLVLYTGMRSNEALQAQWRWLRWEEDLVIIPAKVTKTKDGRMVPLQPELRDLLKPLAKPAGPILEGPLAKATVDDASKGFKTYLTTIGVQAQGRIVHRLRHCCSALLTVSGMSHFEVMEYLGHKDIRVAQKYSRGAKLYRKQVKEWKDGHFRFMALHAATDQQHKEPTRQQA
ncbi:MAG: hypothetical protein EA401_08060 [Planctomycetota bacterium]|nr:MAG: hypothetical protein EA401_08060 [Planctomycetota bacterium]